MRLFNGGLIINNIVLPINASFEEAFLVARDRLKRLGAWSKDLSLSIFKRSIDARRKDDIKLVYSVLASGELPVLSNEKMAKAGVSMYSRARPVIEYGTEVHGGKVLVVGAGPCGLFAALLLAECGIKPIIIERGGSIAERTEEVESFKNSRILDENTNIQFGAGGAGTFSDGKLITRINDPLTNYVLERFVEYGAPCEILNSARPHIGTDVLSVVIQRMIDKIVSLGGEIRYHCRFIDYIQGERGIKAAVTTDGEIECSNLILATGHSSRDTYTRLINRGLDIVAKSFSVGMRIEHLADDIDRAMYGEYAGHPSLGHAEYNLSYNTKQRGVYTFCMCPGGVVVPATSEAGGVVSNGMSYHKRDGRNSNSAVCCIIFTSDYDGTALGAIEFQRRIERAAYIAGGSSYSAPITTVGDLFSSKRGTEPTRIIPTYMDGEGVSIASPYDYLPSFVVDNIKNGIQAFDRQIQGFAAAEAILTGAETRTSSPVRILRDSELGICPGIDNLYPSGEGAGYAGGITSAAIDGLRTALKIIKKYRHMGG